MTFFIFCSESKIKNFPHCAGSRTSIKRERNTLSVVSIAPKSFRYVEEKNRKNLEREKRNPIFYVMMIIIIVKEVVFMPTHTASNYSRTIGVQPGLLGRNNRLGPYWFGQTRAFSVDTITVNQYHFPNSIVTFSHALVDNTKKVCVSDLNSVFDWPIIPAKWLANKHYFFAKILLSFGSLGLSVCP